MARNEVNSITRDELRQRTDTPPPREREKSPYFVGEASAPKPRRKGRMPDDGPLREETKLPELRAYDSGSMHYTGEEPN